MCEPILWISNDRVGFSDVPGSSTSSSMWSRPNHDKEEKGIVPGQRLGTSASGGGPSAGLKRETFAANNPFLLHVVVHVLEGVKAKVPSPQFILNLGWDNPQYESRCRNTRDESPTCYAPSHQQQNGYPNNKEVYNTCVTVLELYI